MKSLIVVAGGALLLAANAAGAAPMPSGHSQHHAAGRSASLSDRQCASKSQMQQMMTMMQQMMQMHQQMMSQGMQMHMNDGMKMPMQPPNPGQNPAPPEQHQH